MTPDRILTEAKTVQTGEAAVLLVNPAFKSKRIDLIRACFRAPQLNMAFMVALEKEPASVFYEDIILSLLQEPWQFDLEPDQTPKVGSYPPPILQEICIGALAPRLPDEGLRADDEESIRKLSSLASRKRLATQFKEALVKERGVEPGKQQGVSPQNPGSKGNRDASSPGITPALANDGPPSPQVSDAPTLAVAPRTDSIVQGFLSTSVLWWCVAGLGILSLILWLVFKHRSSK